jgi:hypothetical protein
MRGDGEFCQVTPGGGAPSEVVTQRRPVGERAWWRRAATAGRSAVRGSQSSFSH